MLNGKLEKTTQKPIDLLDYTDTVVFIVSKTLKKYPEYRYMREDLISECFIFFYSAVDTWDAGKTSAPFRTYLCYQLTWFLTKHIFKQKNEVKKRYKYSQEPKEDSYVDGKPEAKDTLRFICAELTDREIDIVIYRFLFGYTLQEIGLEHSLSKERIRQILLGIKRKIKYSTDTLDF